MISYIIIEASSGFELLSFRSLLERAVDIQEITTLRHTLRNVSPT